MVYDEIEQLVSATFQEAELYSKSREGFLFEEDLLEQEEAPGESHKAPPESAGILYYLQKSSSTFVLRILATKNLREEWAKVLASPENYPSLRLLAAEDERSPDEKLNFFECDNFQLAKALKEQMANKRFPLHEERVLNVSDPGDNWWLKPEAGGLTIYFKLSRTESMDELVKAGPLGDAASALAIFNKLYGYFALLFPVKNFSSAHGQFSLSSEDAENPLFRDLREIFFKGEVGNHLWERLRKLEEQSVDAGFLNSLKRANYFLMEIATFRSFWIEVESNLP